ncbi:fluoride efflux transporter CrcB [Lewinellaceae bacterium SD302]|nr:fluoride efflux transporter CrcB [Lewinellaceae bacterium SD302]
MNFLLVFLGGGLGSCARYGIGRLLTGGNWSQFPIATLLANLLACLVLGYGLSLAASGRLTEAQKLILLTGFCGGFSTFSTFSAEILNLWASGRSGTAALYTLLSIASGVGVIWVLTK